MSLVAWLGGQPRVAAATKRTAGIKGDLDHSGLWALDRHCRTALVDSETATPKQNMENRAGANSSSLSGVRGVTLEGNRWRASVTHGGATVQEQSRD